MQCGSGVQCSGSARSQRFIVSIASHSVLSIGQLEIEEKPTKTLVLLWVIFAAELAFDLSITIIALQALLGGNDECCGESIQPEILPLTIIVPFLLLLVAELGFLFQVIIITHWAPFQNR
jgi:hypothetical protein